MIGERTVGLWYGLAAYGLWGLFPLYWKLFGHVPAAQLADEPHVVVAGDAERGAAFDHAHDQAEHARRVGAAVYEVAEEHRLPAGRGRRLVALDAVAEIAEERHQLLLAAVYVADDVEGPGFLAAVVPEPRARDDGLVRLLGRPKDVHVAEPLAGEPAQRTAELLALRPLLGLPEAAAGGAA